MLFLKHMSLVDVLIILLLIAAISRGIQAGMLQLIFSSAGFIGGLLLGSWLAKSLAVHSADPYTKLFIVLTTELVLASLFAAVGELAGFYLNRYAIKLHLGKINQALGASLEVVFTLFVIWMVAAALMNVRSYNIGRDIRRSAIIRAMDRTLPKPPDVFATLEKIISPNGFPNVFIGLEPQHATISPNNSVNSQAVLADEKSVVQLRGDGCGGTVYGSGFVVAKGIVVTNAHVVAGIARPQVLDQTGTYNAVPIWFDPNMDVAVLRVNGLPDPPLTLNNQVLPDRDAAAVLGYPGGGPLVAGNGAIIDHVTAEGQNIYNQGVVYRDIYEVQVDVEPGNSGGPLVAPDGSVAGVVFAKSLSQNNVGYALLMDEVSPIINNAERQNTPVGTGSCAQG